MPATLRQIGRLVMLLARDRSGRIGFAAFAVILALEFAMINAQVRLIAWNAAFYDAIQKRDVDAAITQIGVFFALTFIGAGLFLVGRFLRLRLQMRWRRVLNETALSRWLQGKTYWHMANATASAGAAATLDNPDQRIAEDCRLFVDGLAEQAIDLIAAIVALVSYVVVLWSLSDFPLAFTLFGVAVEIPRYLLWLAPIYVLFSSIIVQWLGGPLKRITMEQQHREADYRFALARLRESADTVALSQGEAAERRILDRRFDRIVENWGRFVGRDFTLGLFTRPYFMTVLNIPLFIVLPAYLAGHVTFGGLMQVRSSFSSVTSKLSWFIFNYRDLIALGAAAGRLDGFLIASDPARPRVSGIDRATAPAIRTRALTLTAADGTPLIDVPDLVITPGTPVWIRGASGIGKTTFLKAVAGIWPHGRGELVTPSDGCLFLPQQAYVPLDTLAAGAIYPADPASLSADEIAALFARVGLDPASDVACLSGGERQRLGLARLLVHRPAWAFLDEATAALDPAAEEALLAALSAELPGTTFVLIAHRPPRGLGTLREIDLSGRGLPDRVLAD